MQDDLIRYKKEGGIVSYRDKGLLHASKIGSKCYYLESDLIAFIESGRSGNKAPLTFSTDH